MTHNNMGHEKFLFFTSTLWKWFLLLVFPFNLFFFRFLDLTVPNSVLEESKLYRSKFVITLLMMRETVMKNKSSILKSVWFERDEIL